MSLVYVCFKPFSGPQCPNENLVAQVNEVTGVPIFCDQYLRTCGPGYQCLPAGGKIFICCGYVGVCPPGLDVYRDPQGFAKGCGGATSQNQCPAGSTCEFAVGHVGRTQYICCRGSFGSGSAFRCATGAQPWINEITRQPQHCLGRGKPGCPNNYHCEPNYDGTGFYCCRNIANNAECPADYTAAATNGVRHACDPYSLQDRCELPYTCLKSITGSGYLCCRQTGTSTRTGTCSNGQSPSQTCVAGSNTCPNGRQCVLLQGTNQYGCCLSTTSTCSDGSTPRSSCSFVNDNSCTGGSTCQRLSTGSFGCCGSSNPPGACPDGLQATSTACTIGLPGTCGGGGLECVRTSNGQPGCCRSSSGGCPNNRLPDVSNRSCSGGSGSCRQGYECVSGVCCRGPRCRGGVTIGSGPNGLPITCTSGGGVCPANQNCQPSSDDPSLSICCPN